MRDMLLVKDLWLLVQFGHGRPDKIDALTWKVMQLKMTDYIQCFIDMILYNNFNVKLRYQDGSSMEEHMNAFQRLINQTTSLEVPLADEVLALLLLGSLPDS